MLRRKFLAMLVAVALAPAIKLKTKNPPKILFDEDGMAYICDEFGVTYLGC